MSTTINETYTQPWSVGLYALESSYVVKPEYYGGFGSNVGVKDDSQAYVIAFCTSHTNHRVQWRIRRRKSPAYAAIDPAYNGGDVWVGWDGTLSGGSESANEWGAWQGTTTETATTLVDTYIQSEAKAKRVSTTFPFTYDFTNYDLNEYQIRVQAFNVNTINGTHYVSEWAYATVQVGYCPQFELTVTRAADGTDLNIDSNWSRDDNLFRLVYPLVWTKWNDGTETLYPAMVDAISETIASDATLPLPFKYTSYASNEDEDDRALRFTEYGEGGGALFKSSDGFTGTVSTAQQTKNGHYYALVTDATPTGGITDPSSASIDANGTITVSDEGYDTMYATATWSDEDGNQYSQQIDMTKSGSTWTGYIDEPPFDVTYNVIVSATDNGAWNFWVYEMTVPSANKIMLDWGDSHFEMRYNTNRAMSVDLVNDTVSIAGKTLPVSMYSTSRTNPITVIGTLINPTEQPYIGDSWIRELEILNEPHDWILRTPGGMRRRVMVESYQPVWTGNTANTLMDVTITMQEVSE